MKKIDEENPKRIHSQVMRIGGMGEERPQMLNCSGYVRVWLISCMLDMDIGAMYMEMNITPYRNRSLVGDCGEQNGQIFIGSVTVFSRRGVYGLEWWYFWAAARVCLSLYSYWVHLVVWWVISRRVGPVKPMVRFGDCSSDIFRAYHPISGLAARRRMSSAWYALTMKSETSVSTG